MDMGRSVGDASGCKASYSNHEWTVSYLGYSTVNSSYLIVVRITLRSNSKYVDDIRETGW